MNSGKQRYNASEGKQPDPWVMGH